MEEKIATVYKLFQKTEKEEYMPTYYMKSHPDTKRRQRHYKKTTQTTTKHSKLNPIIFKKNNTYVLGI